MAFERRRRRSLFATTLFFASLACGAGIVGCGSDDTLEETPMADAGDDGDVATSDTGGGVDAAVDDTGTTDSTVTDSGADTRDSSAADASTDATDSTVASDSAAADSAATDSGEGTDSEVVDSGVAADTIVDDSTTANDTMTDETMAADTMAADTIATADSAVPDGVVVDAVNDVGGTCATACDCEPGFACISNKCQVGVVAVYCCSSSACPTNAVCQSTNAQYGQCTGGDAGFDAQFDTTPDAAGFCGSVNCQNAMTCTRIGCGTCVNNKCTAP